MLKIIMSMLTLLPLLACSIQAVDGGSINNKGSSGITAADFSYQNVNQSIIDAEVGKIYLNSLRFGLDAYSFNSYAGAEVDMNYFDTNEKKGIVIRIPNSMIKINMNRDPLGSEKKIMELRLTTAPGFSPKQVNLSNYNSLCFDVWVNRDCKLTTGIGDMTENSGDYRSLPFEVKKGGIEILTNKEGYIYQNRIGFQHVVIPLRYLADKTALQTLLYIAIAKSYDTSNWTGLEIVVDNVSFEEAVPDGINVYPPTGEKDFPLYLFDINAYKVLWRGGDTCILSNNGMNAVVATNYNQTVSWWKAFLWDIIDFGTSDRLSLDFNAFPPHTTMMNPTLDLTDYNTLEITAKASRDLSIQCQFNNNAQVYYDRWEEKMQNIGSISLETTNKTFTLNISSLRKQSSLKLLSLIALKVNDPNWGNPVKIYLKSIVLKKTGTPPAESVSFQSTLTSYNRLRLYWSGVSESTKYRISRYKKNALDAIGTTEPELVHETTSTSWTDLSIKTNVMYYYKLQCYNPAGGYSTGIWLGSAQKPGSFTGLNIALETPELTINSALGQGYADIYWSSCPEATHYILYKKLPSDTNWLKIQTFTDASARLGQFVRKEQVDNPNCDNQVLQYKLTLSNDYETKSTIKSCVIRAESPNLFNCTVYGNNVLFTWKHPDCYTPTAYKLYYKAFNSTTSTVVNEFTYRMERNSYSEIGPGSQTELLAKSALPEGYYSIKAVKSDGSLSAESTVQALKYTAVSPDLLVVMDKGIYNSDVKNASDAWTNQLKKDGYSASILLWNDPAVGYDHYNYQNSIKMLRNIIKNNYTNRNKLYVMLVGNIPVPWFEHVKTSSTEFHDVFPMDYYYMDLDGTYQDKYHSSDAGTLMNVFDTVEDSPDVELAVSRLPGNTYTISRYFDKNVSYRKGSLGVPANGYYWASSDMQRDNTSVVQNATKMKQLYQDCDFDTNRAYADVANMINHLNTDGAEMVLLAGHGSPDSIANPDAGMRYFTIDRIRDNNMKGLFWFLSSCKVGRYTEAGGSVASSLVLDNFYGLFSLASTRTFNSGDDFDLFMDSLNSGKTVGEAYINWANNYLRLKDNGSVLLANGRMQFVMFGDPTLKISPASIRN